MQFKYFSKNGKILPVSDAHIPLNNIEYSYGYGVYELISIRNHIVYFANGHINRLLKSAKIIGLDHYFTPEKIQEFIDDLLKKSDVDSCNIKILLVGGKSSNDAMLYILLLSPLFPERKLYTQGVKTITIKYERAFPNAKTLNMLGSFLAFKKAKENDCFDALLINNENKIIEGTRTNFFLIKDKTIYTQSDNKILQGVTRHLILNIAYENNFSIKFDEISTSKLPNFDCGFLTGTTAKILPIRQIDNFYFNTIPKNLKLLMSKFDNFLKESKGAINP
jgi:branched-chain amino acid aminotransferase